MLDDPDIPPADGATPDGRPDREGGAARPPRPEPAAGRWPYQVAADLCRSCGRPLDPAGGTRHAYFWCPRCHLAVLRP